MSAHPSHRCPLCRADGSTPFFRSDGRRLKRDYLLCAQCQLVWVPARDQLSPQAEKARYDLHQNSAADEGYRRHLQRLSTPLLGSLAPAARGLDFGCGPFSSADRDETRGPVLQSMLVEAGHPTAIYDLFYAPDATVLQQTYDFITATEVVEHLRAPRDELDRLWRQLRPGGVLAIMTQLRSPTRDFATWHYKNDPTHIAFFAKATLEHLAMQWHARLELANADVALFWRS